jgi:hypothetical protein
VHGGQPGSYAGYVIDKLQKRLRDAKHWLVRPRPPCTTGHDTRDVVLSCCLDLRACVQSIATTAFSKQYQ